MFKVEEVFYCDHNFTRHGVRPDESKIKAIQEVPSPSSKKDVESLLGTINYLAKFVSKVANITAPIRELLKKEVEFHWSHEQGKSFDEIKEILTSKPGPVLKFFDLAKPVTVRCDASKNGLGAVLIQEEHSISYASRSLSEAETRYAQIENELLSVLFDLERFNVYTHGVKVLIENDHNPLEIILKKSLQDAPPRLQRMLLRLQKYDFVIKHKLGKDLVVADTLWRAPLPVLDPEIEKEISYYVHTVVSNMPMSDEMIMRLPRATSEDESLQELKTTVINGWRKRRERHLQKFESIGIVEKKSQTYMEFSLRMKESLFQIRSEQKCLKKFVQVTWV